MPRNDCGKEPGDDVRVLVAGFVDRRVFARSNSSGRDRPERKQFPIPLSHGEIRLCSGSSGGESSDRGRRQQNRSGPRSILRPHSVADRPRRRTARRPPHTRQREQRWNEIKCRRRRGWLHLPCCSVRSAGSADDQRRTDAPLVEPRLRSTKRSGAAGTGFGAIIEQTTISVLLRSAGDSRTWSNSFPS